MIIFSPRIPEKIMFPFAQLLEALCLLAALIFLRRETGYWKAFPYFLAFTLLVEILGRQIPRLLHQSNHWLYNIYLLVQVTFTGYMLYRVFPFPAAKRGFVTALMLFLALYAAESVWGGFSYNSVSDTFSSFLLVCACGFYYYFLLRKEEYVALGSYAPFWFVSGVFLFNFGSMASNLFSDDMMHLYIQKGLSLRYVIFLGLNVILYSCWTHAFKCRYQKNISSC